MRKKYKNLVFAGGGILSIAYLGVLDYLYANNMMDNIKRVAGTSAGAITACLCSFSTSFEELKETADSLEYYKIPHTKKYPNKIPIKFKKELERGIGNINCLLRLINNYGWYSSEYFYNWLQKTIASKFDINKKAPPYTFKDFKNSDIHKNKKPFMDLYITGTNISANSSCIFCHENTPNMEVAKAVKISMSIPFFFEPVKNKNSIYCDGGMLLNYPIDLFDPPVYKKPFLKAINTQTLGAKFIPNNTTKNINTISAFVENLTKTYMRAQDIEYNSNPKKIIRTIEIDTKNISSTNFNVRPNDKIYNFLYNQGYTSASQYFSGKRK